MYLILLKVGREMMIRLLFTHFMLALMLVLDSSCIHLNSTENKSLNLENSKHSYQDTLNTDNLRIDNLIYTESVFPLEVFLKKLLAGDFNEALRKIDLNYKPSNVDNQIISELIKEGLVPVYVNIKNTGVESIKISEKNFYIYDLAMQTQALSSENMPKEFKRFNSKALVANVYNVGVAVVATIAALAVVSIVFRGDVSGFAPKWDSKRRYSPNIESKSSKSDILNKTEKTIHIDYRNYLISEQVIEPNNSLEGLLFFRFRPNSANLHLKFQ